MRGKVLFVCMQHVCGCVHVACDDVIELSPRLLCSVGSWICIGIGWAVG